MKNTLTRATKQNPFLKEGGKKRVKGQTARPSAERGKPKGWLFVSFFFFKLFELPEGCFLDKFLLGFEI